MNTRSKFFAVALVFLLAPISIFAAGFSFQTNLKQGDSSSDVMQLQKVLNSSISTMVATSGFGSPGNETNYFGNLTRLAVIKFQEIYATEVLNPIGLTSGTGVVGSLTRSKLNQILRGPDYINSGTVINSTNTLTNTTNLTASISASPVEITLGNSSSLTWSSANTTACSASEYWSGSKGTSGTETVTPLTVGTKTYTITCSGTGGNVSRTVTVYVTSSTSNQNSNPYPTTTSISPTFIAPGGPSFFLTVYGTNFVASSTVNFDGSPRDTIFASSTQLSAIILSTDLAIATTTANGMPIFPATTTKSSIITVTTPTPGGGISNGQAFLVGIPTGAIVSSGSSSDYVAKLPCADSPLAKSIIKTFGNKDDSKTLAKVSIVTAGDPQATQMIMSIIKKCGGN